MTEFLMLIFHVLVFPGALFCIVVGLLLAGIDRKLVARMQNRKGPSLLQPLYDVLKCCGKETIVPRHARRGLFLGAPVVGFAALITTALFIPVMSYSAFSTGADLVVILYLLTLTSVTMMVGAAASGSPFAGVGLSREMVAMISYELPFVLLSDPELQAIQAYGVWQEKKLYGKVSMGVVRSTYLIDEQGVIEKVMPKVKPDTNAAEILAYLNGEG